MLKAATTARKHWPAALADQSAAIQSTLASFAATVEEVAARFLKSKQNKDRIEELLDTLVSLGRARELQDGRFLAV